MVNFRKLSEIWILILKQDSHISSIKFSHYSLVLTKKAAHDRTASLNNEFFWRLLKPGENFIGSRVRVTRRRSYEQPFIVTVILPETMIDRASADCSYRVAVFLLESSKNCQCTGYRPCTVVFSTESLIRLTCPRPIPFTSQPSSKYRRIRSSSRTPKQSITAIGPPAARTTFSGSRFM